MRRGKESRRSAGRTGAVVEQEYPRSLGISPDTVGGRCERARLSHSPGSVRPQAWSAICRWRTVPEASHEAGLFAVERQFEQDDEGRWPQAPVGEEIDPDDLDFSLTDEK